MNRCIYKFSAIIIAFCSFAGPLSAQVKPIASQYYQNPYFVNPAFAGLGEGLSVNMSYSINPNNNQGSQNQQVFTTDLNLKKSGIGIYYQGNESGLLNVKAAKVTYAYHLNVSELEKLHFGLSAGLTQERFDYASFSKNELNDQSDPAASQFNDRKALFNVDFGAAYTTEKFSFQISVLNLRKVESSTANNAADRNYYGAAAYKIFSDEKKTWMIEPLIAFSKSKYYEDRFDAGVKLAVFNNQFSLTEIYRSDNIFSSGLALQIMKGVIFQGAYHSNFSNYNSINSGVMELAVKVNFKGKKI